MGFDYEFTTFEAIAILIGIAVIIIGVALYVHKKHKQ